MKNVTQNTKLANYHSAQCFLNSLFREWPHYTYDVNSSSFKIKDKTKTLIIGIDYVSRIGRHSYTGEFKIEKENDIIVLSFEEMVEEFFIILDSYYKTSPSAVEVFKKRIFESRDNIATNLDLQKKALEDFFEEDDSIFIDAEESLYIGHTFHPHPKNRDGFSLSDSQKYTPESRGSFELEWFLVRPEFLHQHDSKYFTDHTWANHLFLNEPGIKTSDKEKLTLGFSAYSVHPYQKKHLLAHPDIQSYIADGSLIVVSKEESESSPKWQATSSLRSIYNKESNYMLKFSLTVRLTNSIRHLLAHEVIRGLQVVDVLNTASGKKYLSEHPNFNILCEPSFMSLKDKNGKIINESIVSLRDNPFKRGSDKNIFVLATLTEDHPSLHKSKLGLLIGKRAQKTNNPNEEQKELAKEWLKAFLEVAFNPLLLAQAQYGIYFGAHQQNLILELKDGLPVKGFFRDCQGTGYSKMGHELFSQDVDLITLDNGNILTDHMGNSLVAYYLAINSTFNVISSLARDTGVLESELLKIYKKNLEDLKKLDNKDSSLIDYLLFGKTLNQKGNFLCSIIDLNENMTENPLEIYNEMANPLVGLE